MAAGARIVVALAFLAVAGAFPYSGFSTAGDDMTLLMANDGTSTYYFYSSQGGTANVVKYNTVDPTGATPVWTTSWNLDGTGTGTTLAYEDVLVPHNMHVYNGELGLVASAKISSSDGCEAKRLVAIKISTSDGSITHESENSVSTSPTNNLGYMSNSFCNGKIYNVYAVYASTGHHTSQLFAFDMATAVWSEVGRNTTNTEGAKAFFVTCGETGTGVEGTSVYLSAVSMRREHATSATYSSIGFIDKYSSSMTWEWTREGQEGNSGTGPNLKLFYDANFKKADGTAMILAVGFLGWGPWEVDGGGHPNCASTTTGMGFKALSTADGSTQWAVTSGYPSVNGAETTTWPISVCTSSFSSLYCPGIYDVSFQVAFLPSGEPVIAFPYKGDFDGSGSNVWSGLMDIVIVSIDKETGSQLSVRQVGSTGDDYLLGVEIIDSELYITAVTLGAGYQTESHVGGTDIVVDKIVLEECPPGQYFTGNPPCSDCAVGYYTDSVGALICKACPAGSSSNSTRSGCDLCAAGTYTGTDGASTGCVGCAAGSFSPSEGSTFCSTCSSGSYASGVNNTSCEQCPISMYQPDSGQSSCIDCPNKSNTLSTGASDAKLCQCAEDYFGNPTGTLEGFVSECYECPKYKTSCARGQRWPAPTAGRYLSVSEPLVVYECSPKVSCPGGAVDSCAEGYQGTGCVECADGWTREYGECQECPTEPPLWQILMGTVLASGVLFIAGMGIFCFALWKSLVSFFCQQLHDNFLRLKKLVTDLSRTVFKYLIRYIQIMSIALSLDVPWPNPVSHISLGFDTLNSFLVLSNFIKVDCFPQLNVESVSMVKLVAQVLLLVLLLGSFLCLGLGFWLCSCLSPRCGRRFKVGLLVSILMQVVNVLYLSFHTYAVTVFSCYKQAEKDGRTTYRLISDPTIECYVLDGSEWSYMLPTGIGFFVLISCGVPLLFLLFIFLRTRKRFQKSHFFMWATTFLADPYKEEYHYMEVVSLAERFLIPMTSVLAPLGSVFQTFYLTMITLVFILIHWRRNTFALYEEWVWIMQVNVSILVTMIVAVSLAQKTDSTAEETEEEAANLMTSLVYTSSIMIGMLTLYSLFAAVRDNFCKRLGSGSGAPVPDQEDRPDVVVMDGSDQDEAGLSDEEVVIVKPEEDEDDEGLYDDDSLKGGYVREDVGKVFADQYEVADAPPSNKIFPEQEGLVVSSLDQPPSSSAVSDSSLSYSEGFSTLPPTPEPPPPYTNPPAAARPSPPGVARAPTPGNTLRELLNKRRLMRNGIDAFQSPPSSPGSPPPWLGVAPLSPPGQRGSPGRTNLGAPLRQNAPPNPLPPLKRSPRKRSG